MIRFGKFALVGAIGFLADAAALMAVMLAFGADPLFGRAASIPCATLTTWLLNRRFTFETTNGATVDEGLRYAAVKGVGLATNLATYGVVVLYVTKDAYPLLALAAASLASLSVNFALVKRFVFSSPQDSRAVASASL